MTVPEAAGPVTARSTTRRVLVVDDEPGVRVVLGRALARWDYEVFLTEGAEEALAQLTDGPAVDILVSDVNMPGMTGLELAAEVRTRHPGLPILFVTASAVPVELSTDPLIDVAYKPVRIAEIRERVAALINWSDRPGQGATTGDPAPTSPPSADAMEPADGDPLRRMTEGLELVVPGLPEQLA